jgi:hypothetical protein
MLTHRSIPGARRGQTPARKLAVLAVALAATWIDGCASRRTEAPPPPPPPRPEHGPPVGAVLHDIVPGRSHVTLYVRRAGPLARLGHDHVVTSDQAAGYAWLGREQRQSGFELRLPVASFVVDDPDARAAAGTDFAGDVPIEAREATYRNLLRPEVLDAARYPEIVVRCEGLSGTWEKPVATVQVTLKDTARLIDVPLGLQRSDRTLEAEGSFRIRQTDFGLTPFSVAGGAVQVADEVEIRFAVVAVRR